MRRAFCFIIFLMCLLISQIAFAGFPVIPDADPKPANTPVIKLDGSAMKTDTKSGVEQITQVRWANRIDAVTGASTLRLVFDVTGPVEADGAVTNNPTPRLTVNVKGVQPGKVTDSVDLDGKIADSLSISAVDGQNSKIVIELPMMVDDGDYKVFTLPSDAKANKPFRVVVDINKPVPPMTFNFTPGLKNKVITIDPGHGGTDPGAIGPAKTPEKTVTLAVALKVKALLERAGAKVLMTRTDDIDVYGPNSSAVDELSARTKVANSKKADLFLSIHANSFTDRTVGGTATYYYQKTPYDTLLAQNIQSSLAQAGGLKDRGYFPANFFVIKRTIMPAALAELAFVSNPDEEKLLSNPVFQQKMAQGIVQGLDNFFTQAAKMGGER